MLLQQHAHIYIRTRINTCTIYPIHILNSHVEDPLFTDSSFIIVVTSHGYNTYFLHFLKRVQIFSCHALYFTATDLSQFTKSFGVTAPLDKHMINPTFVPCSLKYLA